MIRDIVSELTNLIAIQSLEEALDDVSFNRYALALFRYQYEGIESYRQLCDRRNLTPPTVSDYREIPSVPTDAFKHLSLFSGTKIARTFLTSGTMQGGRGAHHFETLDIYRASMDRPFSHFLLGDLAPCPFLILAPGTEDLLESSLSFMLSEMADKYASRVEYFVDISIENELEMRYQELAKSLDEVREPVLILGTAFALVGFFDTYSQRRWSLPKGSVVMETGGLKGRGREINRKSFYEMIIRFLGVLPTHIVSEYSMTELSSQAYTNSYAENLHWEKAVYKIPPWARVDLVNPMTMKVEDGLERGMLRWFDLANLHSVSAILTSDIGKKTKDGFLLFGRASEAELRGCSLTIEEILE